MLSSLYNFIVLLLYTSDFCYLLDLEQSLQVCLALYRLTVFLSLYPNIFAISNTLLGSVQNANIFCAFSSTGGITGGIVGAGIGVGVGGTASALKHILGK